MSALALAFPLCVALARAQAPADDARVLFEKHCASCHGANGDGKGTTVLERPARSFKDGGFSYGNTKETIARTLAHGIPGTPMPGFGAMLKRDELAALADYVIALGPPQAEVRRSDTLLAVRDRPLFARGKLPPLVPTGDGAPETVRGLLVGTPEGLTFQLDVEELRLLGVRQGEFVERKDWGGRGGAALLPLGKLVYDCGAGARGAAELSLSHAFVERPKAGAVDVPLSASLRGTQIRDGRAWLYAAWRAEGRPVGATGKLSFSAHASALGSGFARTLELDSWTPGEARFHWCIARRKGATLVASGPSWCVLRGADGVHELHRIAAAKPTDALALDGERVVVDASGVLLEGATFEGAQDARASSSPALRIEVVTVPLATFDDAVRAQLEQEVAR